MPRPWHQDRDPEEARPAGEKISVVAGRRLSVPRITRSATLWNAPSPPLSNGEDTPPDTTNSPPTGQQPSSATSLARSELIDTANFNAAAKTSAGCPGINPTTMCLVLCSLIVFLLCQRGFVPTAIQATKCASVHLIGAERTRGARLGRHARRTPPRRSSARLRRALRGASDRRVHSARVA